jgi:KUP system potassium uptake protein
VPRTLLHTLALFHVLHRVVIVLSVHVEALPRIGREPLTIERFAPDLIGIVARYGYMERPNIPRLMHDLKRRASTSTSSDSPMSSPAAHVVVTRTPGMAMWRKRLYALMAPQRDPATSNYRLPSERVLEVGVQVEI